MGKTICIIGSSQYKERIMQHKEELEKDGKKVLIPAFDSHPDFSVLDIMRYNLGLIRQSNEVHLIWDCRSPGAWGDWCMAFALDIPVVPIYLEPKKMEHAIIQWHMEKSE